VPGTIALKILKNTLPGTDVGGPTIEIIAETLSESGKPSEQKLSQECPKRGSTGHSREQHAMCRVWGQVRGTGRRVAATSGLIASTQS
jgi:hypothetical protein